MLQHPDNLPMLPMLCNSTSLLPQQNTLISKVIHHRNRSNLNRKSQPADAQQRRSEKNPCNFSQEFTPARFHPSSRMTSFQLSAGKGGKQTKMMRTIIPSSREGWSDRERGELEGFLFRCCQDNEARAVTTLIYGRLHQLVKSTCLKPIANLGYVY
ncbi:hypothetical protein CDAR_451211 [Caerostris darwini]|uniref:Uncharacterized protein n=1 Tax=Caerostris darwini TaxID=1538125 RepID=A0AAV4SYA2_9ARAC|nr:hypothetical protein CDAR_451211 [Caerostris darwini]